jgi:hypothetical protein
MVALEDRQLKKAPPLVFVLALVATLNGCATVGPKSIRDGRFDYNRAIIDTRNEQMLANLVRMRYRDPPFFLEVSSVSTQYVFGGSAAAGARLGNTGAESRANVGAGAAYEERPTVTYLPLKGDEFVHRLLSPVEMEAVVLLARADRIGSDSRPGSGLRGLRKNGRSLEPFAQGACSRGSLPAALADDAGEPELRTDPSLRGRCGDSRGRDARQAPTRTQ